MPVKAPMYLKTSQLQKGKKHLRLRDVLTPDMISPPLGDFRHTAHLGSAVSTEELSLFMDISFLGTPCNETPLSPLSPTTFAAWDGSPIQSPALKNAISLPGTDAPRAVVPCLLILAPCPPRSELESPVGLPECPC
uniref:CRIB domain-containing protein n=1 Tax=Eptatretus burgeri TaxID=7764 RepID=A0A8C4R7X4_EPTBU